MSSDMLGSFVQAVKHCQVLTSSPSSLPEANFPLTSREQQMSLYPQLRDQEEAMPQKQYSACWEKHLKASCQYCEILLSNCYNRPKKKITILAWSTFPVVFTAVPWQTNDKIQSHIPCFQRYRGGAPAMPTCPCF